MGCEIGDGLSLVLIQSSDNSLVYAAVMLIRFHNDILDNLNNVNNLNNQIAYIINWIPFMYLEALNNQN